ncbi:MAG: pyridoxamine 5'-phosphate oxidase family protein [Deltaproteobacteria bacterium]|nr:pyridoxamine 5'-phosphate oxidase family protein [Candidatus Zymogenaceae bacterium]
MRKKEREITDPAGIRDVLTRAVVLRLGLFDGRTPYIVPVNFGYDGKAALFIHSGHEGWKMEILKHHPRVCFEAEVDVAVIPPVKPDNHCGFSMAYRSVIGFGVASILDDPARKIDALKTIVRHLSPERSPDDIVFPDGTVEATAVVRIDIDSMTGKMDNC